MRVPITWAMRQSAAGYANAVLANLPNRPNYTGLEVTGRYYLGRLAELCFEAACERVRVRARWLGNSDGRSDGGADYLVGHQRVQIKYTPHNGWRFMENVSERRWSGERPDYYIVIQPNRGESSAKIHGYFTGAEVDAMPIDKGNRGAPFRWARVSTAHPIDNLFRTFALMQQPSLL